jgi:hypothetical protein
MLRLSGMAHKVIISESKVGEYTPVEIRLEMLLKNDGEVSAILLRQKPLFTTARFERVRPNSALANWPLSSFNLATSPDFLSQQAWTGFKRRLNSGSPPPDLTVVLPPGEVIKFAYVLQLNLPPNEIRANPYWTEKSLDQLRELSPLILRLLNCEFGNYGLEGNPTGRRSAFARKLQKRWARYGHLWLNPIDSEPIAVDLGFK